MILAAKYPSAVNKLIIWGANSYVLPEEIQLYESECQFKTIEFVIVINNKKPCFNYKHNNVKKITCII